MPAKIGMDFKFPSYGGVARSDGVVTFADPHLFATPRIKVLIDYVNELCYDSVSYATYVSYMGVFGHEVRGISGKLLGDYLYARPKWKTCALY